MASMPREFTVVSDQVQDGERFIEAHFEYADTKVELEGDTARVTPVRTNYTFQTDKQIPKLGMMIVGLGGNNGSTLTASILANKNNVTWNTKEGKREPNYFGSITQASTVRLGTTADGQDVFIPLGQLVPMVHPNDIVIGGWDINDADLAAATERACVLPYDLQRQLKDDLAKIKPLPSIYIPEFIAANQEERANNVLEGSKAELVQQIRKDIREFKESNQLDKVIVIWSANTERFADVREGLNDTADNLLKSIDANEEEISPSTLFAVACIQEQTAYINGSPQNTFVPGLVEMAEREDVMIGGDDFKSGQTKFKSVLVDFLVTAGIKPLAITSYNHLGNNDGLNLSSAKQFRSKEISKSNVVDDMVASNPILYKPGEHPDHTVVIKYVPTVGDSKRAMDEYVSEIFMGGLNTIVAHNTCEDSLLASPLILDLVILTEVMQRITYKTGEMQKFEHFHPVLSILSYLCKAPLVPNGTPVVNALFKQRAALENILRACVGLPSVNDMDLQYRHHPSVMKA